MEEIIIYPQSVVDLITNSSSEIFVCERGHSLKIVQNIVDDLVKMFYYTGDGILVYQSDDEYWNNAIIIQVDYYPPLPARMTSLLENIFVTGDYLENE